MSLQCIIHREEDCPFCQIGPSKFVAVSVLQTLLGEWRTYIDDQLGYVDPDAIREMRRFADQLEAKLPK